jgi:hypothetical protein
MKKQVFIKTYDTTGTFKGVFYDFIFSQFNKSLNGGLGDLTVTIPRKFDEYNSDGAISLGYELRVYIADSENPSGLQIYSGEVQKIDVKAGDTENVSIQCMGYIFQMALDILESSRVVKFNYASQDLSLIIKDIIDKHRAVSSKHKINYSATSVPNCGVSKGAEFYVTTPLKAIGHIVGQAPSTWFSRVGADNILYFNQISSVPNHYFIMGKDVIDIAIARNLQDVRDHILISNGMPAEDPNYIFQMYTNASASADWGRRIEYKRDERFKSTTNTATNYATRFLDVYKAPINQVQLRIIDSNLAGGYDIEDVEPGDTCKVLNVEDNEALSDNMIITEVSYNIDYIDLKVEDTTSYVARLFDQVNEQANMQGNEDNVPITYNKTYIP